MTTISTSTHGARLMLDLVVSHIAACDVFRRDSTPAVPAVLLPTERSIVLQMTCLGDIRTAILADTPDDRQEIDRIVASLVDDLRISHSRKPWVSSFDDLDTVVSAIQQS